MFRSSPTIPIPSMGGRATAAVPERKEEFQGDVRLCRDRTQHRLAPPDTPWSNAILSPSYIPILRATSRTDGGLTFMRDRLLGKPDSTARISLASAGVAPGKRTLAERLAPASGATSTGARAPARVPV